MPELPEVETVRRGINLALTDLPPIAAVTYSDKKLRVPIAKESIRRALEGARILGARRRAKFLLLDTADATIISHLGMSGSWRFVDSKEVPMKHDHVCIRFADGRALIYHDPRRFGLLLHAKLQQEEKSKWLKNLGPEPLSPQFTAKYLQDKAKNKAAPVKNFIMDQKIVVGVGNIYASEALYQAGVRPKRAAHRLKPQEWQALSESIRRVLEEAIHHGGTTLRDYRNASGEMGEFQKVLYVYGRAKEKCRKCKTLVSMAVLAGRATYWCSQCQK